MDLFHTSWNFLLSIMTYLFWKYIHMWLIMKIWSVIWENDFKSVGNLWVNNESFLYVMCWIRNFETFSLIFRPFFRLLCTKISRGTREGNFRDHRYRFLHRHVVTLMRFVKSANTFAKSFWASGFAFSSPSPSMVTEADGTPVLDTTLYPYLSAT